MGTYQRMFPAAAVVLLAALLLGESLLPGRVLVPLLPGDFQTWREGTFGGLAPATHPHPNWTMSDVVHLFVPGLRVTAEATARGELPLWDPSQACGVPHLAEVHYGVLYPPAWLPLVFGWSGLALLALVHLLVAGLGMAAWLGALGRSPMACAVGAISFAGSAWVTARLQAFPVVGAFVWLPVILWGLERLARGQRRGALIAGAGCALSLLAGFPQVTLWVYSVVAVVELARFAGTDPDRRGRWSVLGRSVIAGCLGLALALPQLLPTLDYVTQESARTRSSPEQIAAQALEAPLLWHLLVPERYASASVPGLHPVALGALDGARQPGALSQPEVSMAIGIPGLLLAVLALLWGRSRRVRLLSLALLALGVLLMLPTALGWGATVFPVLRYGSPLRLLALTTFLLAALAAEGWDVLVARGWQAAVTLAVLAGGVLLALTVMQMPALPVDDWARALKAALGFGELTLAELYQQVPEANFEQAFSRLSASRDLALGAALGALVLCVPFGRGATRCLAQRLPVLLVALMLVELTGMARPLLRPAPEAVRSDLLPELTYRAPALAQAARGAVGERDVPPRVARWGAQALNLRPNLAGLFGLHDVQAYAPMAPRRLVELLTALEPGLVSNGSAIGGFVTEGALSLPAVDLLGLDVVLTQEPATPAGFVEAGRMGAVRILRNDEALPRLFLADRRAGQVVADRDQRLAALSVPDFDPRAQVLLSEEPGLALGAGAGADPAFERASQVVAYRPGRVALRVEAGAPAWLVFTETWHAGWRARVDGDDVPVLIGNHAFVTVPIDATGAVDVELAYEPPLVMTSVWTGAGLVLLLLLGLFRRR